MRARSGKELGRKNRDFLGARLETFYETLQARRERVSSILRAIAEPLRDYEI